MKAARSASRALAAARGRKAFTLLEVMVAMALFFMATFAILDAVNQGLRAARVIDRDVPDVSLLAPDLMLTNRLEEGVVEGDFRDYDPDDRYGTFSWSREVVRDPDPALTNGVFEVTFRITGLLEGKPYESTSVLRFWKPDSLVTVPGLRR
jgi:hypothetical protein